MRDARGHPVGGVVADVEVFDCGVGEQVVQQVFVLGDGSEDQGVAERGGPGFPGPGGYPHAGEGEFDAGLFGERVGQLVDGGPEHGAAVAEFVHHSIAAEMSLGARGFGQEVALAGEAYLEPEPAAMAVGARRMLELLSPPTAAYVISRHSDVLAWNDTAAALFGHLVEGPSRPNNVRYVFTDPGARELFVDWPEIAADSVAHLRAAIGHHPDDAELTALVAELSEISPRFRQLWGARELRHKVDGRKELRHPLVGRITLDYVVLATPLAARQRLVAYSAVPGSESHMALARLLQAPKRRIPASPHRSTA